MKKTLLCMTLLGAALNAGFATASQDEIKQQEEKRTLIGLGSGALLGAAVGGPIGAFAGAFMGSMVADDANDRDALARMEQERDDKHSALLAMQRAFEQQNRQIQLVSAQSELPPPEPSYSFAIQFKTGEHVVAHHYQEALDQLASNLDTYPGLQVTILGYADARGDEQANQALSVQRALSVKSALKTRGVDATRMQIAAFGESRSLSQSSNFENDFFDRRVQVLVGSTQNELIAKQK